MSMMMPEDQLDAEGRPLQGTLFNYNDDWWNNIGTFAANELLGVDDFQRAFGNWDRGDISFWDRLKAGAAGVGEFGTTAALFVPGANIIAGASKIPLAGKLASKTAPFILPTDKVGKIIEGSSSAAAGGGVLAPEDSFLSNILAYGPIVGAAGLAGLGGGRSFVNRRRRNFTEMPGTQGRPWINPETGEQVTYGTPPSRLRQYNPLVSPKTGKVGKGRVVGLGALGLLGTSALGALRNDTVPAQPLTPETGGGAMVNRQQNLENTLFDIIRSSQATQEDMLDARERQALSNIGVGEMSALDEYLAGLNDITSGRTQAIRDEYQNLYDRFAGDVGAIREMGAAGGEAAAGRYRQAANRARREGRREMVSSGVGGLTPVSGAIADMPASARAQGADLATYIRNNAATAARDAGFSAESSLEYGNAVANELANDVAFAGLAQRYALERDIAARRAKVQSGFTDARTQLALKTAQQERDLATELAMDEASRISGVELLANPEVLPRVEAGWNYISSVMSGQLPEGATTATVEGVQAIINALQANYGEVSIESYAQFLADSGSAGFGG